MVADYVVVRVAIDCQGFGGRRRRRRRVEAFGGLQVADVRERGQAEEQAAIDAVKLHGKQKKKQQAAEMEGAVSRRGGVVS